MFNMIFAVILGFIEPENLEEIMKGKVAGEIQITQGLLLVFAMLLEIPIAMFFLSRVLEYKVNRRANIFAAVITIVFVIGGGSVSLHYLFFATIEVACMLLIIRIALKWPQQEA